MHGFLGPLLVTLVTVISTTFAQWNNNYPQYGRQEFFPYPRPSPHQNIYPPTPPARPSPPQYASPHRPQQYPAAPSHPSPPPYIPPPIPKKTKPAGPKKPVPVAPAHPSPMTRAPPMGALGGGAAYNPMMTGGFNQFGGYGGGPMGPMGPMGGKHFCKARCAHKVFAIEPRCGYDGETYRNECELQCETYEACDSTCPCFKGISSPPDHMRFILKPNPRVFPTMAQASGKVPRKGRRRKGRKGKKAPPKKIPNCICTDPTPEMVCSIEGKDIRSACDAFCTHQQIRCEKPCHLCPPFGLGLGARQTGQVG